MSDSDKLYALYAPEVERIAKGKARTRYELGVKTSIAVTNARTAFGQFIGGMQALPGNPYDGRTLRGQIAQVERLTGVTVERATTIAATAATSTKGLPEWPSPPDGVKAVPK